MFKFRLISILIAGILVGVFGTLAGSKLIGGDTVLFFYFLALAFAPLGLGLGCIFAIIDYYKCVEIEPEEEKKDGL